LWIFFKYVSTLRIIAAEIFLFYDQEAIKTSHFFYTVKDTKLAIAGEELISSMKEMDICITNLMQSRTIENREIEVSSFKSKCNKFGDARIIAIIRLTELERQQD
jgi:hypothetical protein